MLTPAENNTSHIYLEKRSEVPKAVGDFMQLLPILADHC